jgi:type IV pilus assembly protein PilA
MERTTSANLLRLARSILGRSSEEVDEGSEGGFTLIELMVVLLIMAILLAIAIPTFLGVKGGAQNRAAQSDLTNAATSAKAVYTNSGSYGSIVSLVSGLQSAEPELSFGQGAVSTASGPHRISVAVSNDGLVMEMAEQSANGLCWYAQDNEEPTTTATISGISGFSTVQGILYGSSNGTTATSCTAGTAAPASSWKSSYPAS